MMLVRWMIALGLLIISANLKSPYLLKFREFETIGLLSVSMIWGWLVFLRIRESKGKKITEKLVLLSVLAIVFLLTCAGETAFRYRKYAVLHTEKQLLHELGKHFVIGYTDVENILPLVSNGAVGGIFVTHRNAKNKSSEKIRNELDELKRIRKSSELPPLIIATDQEGGVVSRLSPPLTALPPLSSLIAKNTPIGEIEEKARKYGEIHGKELSGLGVNVNFAPIADLKFKKPHNPMDFHTLIRDRAISDDEVIVSRIALAYCEGIEKYGVIPTVKHFPGMGKVVNDTHHFSAQLDTDTEELRKKEWVPFRHVLENSGAFMMLGHVILPKTDPDNPVSHSRKVIREIIRGEWKHDGVLVTDDLTMGAIYDGKYGIGGAAVMSLNAGADLLLISYDGEKYYEVMYHVLKAYRNKTLDASMLEKSGKRLGRIFR